MTPRRHTCPVLRGVACRTSGETFPTVGDLCVTDFTDTLALAVAPPTLAGAPKRIGTQKIVLVVTGDEGRSVGLPTTITCGCRYMARSSTAFFNHTSDHHLGQIINRLQY